MAFGNPRASHRLHPFSRIIRPILATLLIGLTAGSCVTAPTPQIVDDDLSKIARPQIAQPKGLAILQGLTNESATQISVVTSNTDSARIHFLDVSTTKPLTEVTERQHSIPDSKIVVRQFLLTKLNPKSTYRLTVLDHEGRELDTRQFRTLDLKRNNLKFAAASCISDQHLEHQSELWSALREAKPDFLLLLGDNNYAAVINRVNKSPLTLPMLWRRYAESALQIDLYHFKELIPTLAIWDDFDYGMKDGGLNHPYGREAKKAFEAYFAQNSTADHPEYSKGPGIAAAWRAFGFEFLLLDNRSFRTETTHFGRDQEQWILNYLAQSRLPTWLISGDQWFGGYHRFESYEGNHKESFKEFLSNIKSSKAHVLFLSGDRHLSEVMKIEPELLGYETYEFTSSPMHAKTYPSNWETIPNRRHWMGIAQELNFNLFEVHMADAKKRLRKMKVRAIGKGGKVFYEAEVPLRK